MAFLYQMSFISREDREKIVKDITEICNNAAYQIYKDRELLIRAQIRKMVSKATGDEVDEINDTEVLGESNITEISYSESVCTND